jgi:hypothetical protein
VAPCDPSVSVRTDPTRTPSSSATRWVKRAVSSMPAGPSTLFLGKPARVTARRPRLLPGALVVAGYVLEDFSHGVGGGCSDSVVTVCQQDSTCWGGAP